MNTGESVDWPNQLSKYTYTMHMFGKFKGNQGNLAKIILIWLPYLVASGLKTFQCFGQNTGLFI